MEASRNTRSSWDEVSDRTTHGEEGVKLSHLINISNLLPLPFAVSKVVTVHPYIFMALIKEVRGCWLGIGHVNTVNRRQISDQKLCDTVDTLGFKINIDYSSESGENRFDILESLKIDVNREFVVDGVFIDMLHTDFFTQLRNTLKSLILTG